ncbi:penicillin-binding transpeptidase domain-containing protein [Peredibacter sp. HCB2-198]|uniref:penicillin-binding transpeptidase domain-containing protein n=1 Tax=Peredibacter sp. HCB2-198 TaxID=3383025 RepID=UPI0038B5B4D9
MKNLFLFLLVSHTAFANVDFKKHFSDREACFTISDLNTGKIIAEYNSPRCDERIPPNSSFKIAASLMAFEKGVFKDENQVIKWDGVKRDRPEINQDLTPMTFMSTSAKWVTEWIMPQLGEKTIQSFLEKYKYGNQDFSGGIKTAWVTSSLKISPHEQVNFLTNFWNGKLASKRSTDLTKKVMFIKKLGNADLYGKTGTGCVKGHGCMQKPGKMFGWFVGVLKNGDKTYVFAGNGIDLKDQKTPGGPRMRDTTMEILTELGLTK